MAGAYGSIDVNNMNEFPSGSELMAEFKLYGRSKLGNILFTIALAEKLKGTNVTVNCLHPGVVQSNLARSASKLFVIPYNYLCGQLFKVRSSKNFIINN